MKSDDVKRRKKAKPASEEDGTCLKRIPCVVGDARLTVDVSSDGVMLIVEDENGTLFGGEGLVAGEVIAAMRISDADATRIQKLLENRPDTDDGVHRPTDAEILSGVMDLKIAMLRRQMAKQDLDSE